MKEWLESLINPLFMPHGHCYLWRPDILWTHVLSDAAIGIAYFLIPLIMGILMMKRKAKLPYPEIFGLFIAFIFLCGTTHFVSIYVTWYPLYEYQGWLKALTAFTSILTVAVLAPKLPLLINLPGIEAAYKESLHELDLMKKEKKQMQNIHQASLQREERVVELKAEINKMLTQQGKDPAYEIKELS